jgi:hypothetical protein
MRHSASGIGPITSSVASGEKSIVSMVSAKGKLGRHLAWVIRNFARATTLWLQRP